MSSGDLNQLDYNKTIVKGEVVFPRNLLSGESRWARMAWWQSREGFRLLRDNEVFADLHLANIYPGNIYMNSGTIDNVASIQFDIEADTACSEGELAWNADAGTIEIGMPGGNVCVQISQEVMLPRAKAGEDISNGEIVYVSGGLGSNPVINLADASVPNTVDRTIAMATEDINNSSLGYCTTFGLVRDVDTSSYTAGTQLFLSATTPGAYTDTAPTHPNHSVSIGYVIRQHALEGVILVKIDVDSELQDLHDVLLTSLTDNDFLYYDSADSVWKNKQLTQSDITDFAHATTHESGGSDEVNHDNLVGYVANEHIEWTNATESLLTSGNITGAEGLFTTDIYGGTYYSTKEVRLDLSSSNVHALSDFIFPQTGVVRFGELSDRRIYFQFLPNDGGGGGYDVVLEAYNSSTYVFQTNNWADIRFIQNYSQEALRLGRYAVVVNEGSANIDFRVESNSNTHMLFVDAGVNTVGINTSTPNSSYVFDVNGTTLVRNKIAFTQTDGNEYIDSEADGFMDYGATTAHRFRANVKLNADNRKLLLGTGDDMSVYYDGTNGYIKTDEVAASDLNIACGTDKTIELQESVWDDINLGAAQLSRPASSQPDTDNFVDNTGADTGIQTYAFAVGEKIHGSFELIHTYKEGTALKPHVHFQIIAAPSGTDYVRWRMTYTIAKAGSTLSPVATVEGECAVDTQYENIFCTLADISGTGLEIGDQFLFTLERIASTGDAFAGDALIQTVGVHHEIDTMGSRQTAVK